MKQFGRTMLTVMGLAVAGAVSSSIPAQAASPVVVTHTGVHGFVPTVGFFTLLDPSNPNSAELVGVTVEKTSNTGYMLIYQIVDFGGGFSADGHGSIPASSVNVSGGTVNTLNVTVMLNVNTCDVPGFTTVPPGTCGTFDLTWVEMPPSIAGSFINRGDNRQTFIQNGKLMTVVTNGQMEIFFALTTGTALGFGVPTTPPTEGLLIKETNVTKTVIGP